MVAFSRFFISLHWLAFLFYGTLLPAKAQNKTAQTSSPRLDSLVMQLMNRAKVQGVSLALIRHAQLDYCKSYGLTKADSTQSVDANTVFEAASLTKPVFAYAVMQLVEEGKIDLDKPLYDYLPYPDASSDKRYKEITARLILSHRSGFPNWRKDRKSNHLSMRFAPGERFGYSGEGFAYLQKAVEKITGKSINDVMEERVLKPLGMTNSGFVWKASFNGNYAYPHDESGNEEQKYRPTQANMAYSLHTTANDYARFMLALLSEKGLKKNTLDQMFSAQTQLPSRFSGSDLAPNSYWGLGIGVEKNPTGTYLWHWGDNGAFKCFVMVNLAEKKGIIYFSNGSNGLDFADELIRQTIGGQHSAFDFLGINWQKEMNKK